MTVLPTELHLDPLLSPCRRLRTRHVSLFGSATRKPLEEVADVDLYVVIPRMDSLAYSELFAAAERTAQALGAQAGRPWCVELRHGPFKPPPDAGRVLQLHFLVDDEASLEISPWVLRTHRAATGHRLIGESLQELGPKWNSRSKQLCEAQAELTRWRDALAAREIAFRHWVFDPDPRLVEGRMTAITAWDLRCLLQGASSASNLHYLAAILTGPQIPGLAGDFARPLLSQIEDEFGSWPDLVECWDRARDQAIAAIDRRLDDLSRM